MTDKRPPFLDVAKRALAKYHPDAIGGFVAGSVIRGQDTLTSDIDITVLYDDTFSRIHRSAVFEEGWLIEFFVHNPQAQNFFFDKDKQGGTCTMPEMVAEGIMIPGPHPLLEKQKSRAKAIVTSGPDDVTPNQLIFQRYLICALLDDLEDQDDKGIVTATLVQLFDILGGFHLRAAGNWSGSGKPLLRILRKNDEAFASRYEQAFAQAFESGTTTLVRQIAMDVIAPYGGWLQEGLELEAPDLWKAFKD